VVVKEPAAGQKPDPRAELLKTLKVTRSEHAGAARVEAATGLTRESTGSLVLDYSLQPAGAAKPAAYHLVQKVTVKLLPKREESPVTLPEFKQPHPR